MNRPAKLLVFVPHVSPDAAGRRLPSLARSLVAAGERSGFSVTLLATTSDLAGRPVNWPTSVHGLVRQLPPERYRPDSQPFTTTAAFEQVQREAPRHDLLFLPQPIGALPAERRLDLPIPVMMSFDSQPPHAEYGDRPERLRREMVRLAEVGTRFLFPTEFLRGYFELEYGLPTERCRVVPPGATPLQGDPEAVRRRYRLPNEYVLSMGWKRRSGMNGVVARAAALLKRRGRAVAPVVGLSEPTEWSRFAGPNQREAERRIRDELAKEGMVEDHDWFDLERIDADDLAGLIRGARLVVANLDAGCGPDADALAASISGVRVFHPRTPGLTERAGHLPSFAPGSVEACAEAIDSFPFTREFRLPGSMSEEATAILAEARSVVRLGERAYRPMTSRAVVPREKRVAWMLAHATLREAEVPVLQQLGYEVYVNKSLAASGDFRSGGVEHAWDADSTLPTTVLRRLNSFNFYQDEYDPEIVELLNAYFGSVIIDAYPMMPQRMVRHFRGRICLRAFGREHPSSYTAFLTAFGGNEFGERCEAIRHRLRFAACYERVIDWEKGLLRERAALMPVAVPDRCLRSRGRWRGDDRRILFVCPSIRSSPNYYGLIYRRFKEVYGDLPHVIAGSQRDHVGDPSVTGYLDDEEYDRLYRDSRVMYYHSREPRHIHYHPLEAILYGMPVVYLRGGLMEEYDTGSRAGACNTDEEARDKLRRILNDDLDLIREVCESQVTILDRFLPERVQTDWERVFRDDVMAEPLIKGIETARSMVPLESEYVVASDREEFAHLARIDPHAMVTGRQPPSELAPPEPVPVPIAFPPRRSLAAGLKARLPAPVFRAARRLYRGLKGARPAPTPVPEPTPVEEQTPSPPEPFESLPTFRDRTLRLDDVLASSAGSTPRLIVDPIGTIDPNLALEEGRSANLTVAFTDLRWEFGDVFGERTDSATREAMLWCRMAEQCLFTSESDRTLAVERYGIPRERTKVRPVLSLLPDERIIPIRPANLPPEYWLAVLGESTQANGVLPLQAALLLKRRGVSLPPLVVIEPAPVFPAERISRTATEQIDDLKHRCELIEGRTLFTLTGLTPTERAGAISGARLFVEPQRGTGGGARDIATALRRGVPVVACDTPLIRTQWGHTVNGLELIHPDDSVPVANAIERRLGSVTLRHAA